MESSVYAGAVGVAPAASGVFGVVVCRARCRDSRLTVCVATRVCAQAAPRGSGQGLTGCCRVGAGWPVCSVGERHPQRKRSENQCYQC